MLNYAYAMLQSRLQIQAVAEGYDPTLGIMHHGYNGSAAYIFDLMEPMRPVVDAAVLGFALATTFSGGDFTLREDGVCRLSPQLAQRVCQIVIG
jgi:CRISPR/Cas system-associated endonuclease Cas1